MLPVQFEVPLANPSPQGLFAATTWTDTPAGAPSRFLTAGVDVRVHNFGGGAATGVWGASWCASPDDLTEDDIKEGVRPANPDTFAPITLWAYDECDLTEPSRAEVLARVQQNLRLREQVLAEREFADRLLEDAGAPTAVADIVAAVGHLEAALAVTGTLGLIHASPALIAAASAANLVQRNGTGLTTPMGHRWVFGGGYVDGLEAALVATSPTFGWRDQVQVRDTMKLEHNLFVAVAERSLLVAYEAVVGAAEITPPTPEP
ncbi:hypothetical protein [Mycobacteroides abscessus]|uniref:hypothetical protein n=1 Tax=Mycobacteroides abscessus TaxID=36809 RepID=UPI000C25E56F|nr:hypothetical protein [Mycobacteroides abscessus]PVB44647.1 hypothetical protein DDJ39_15060 [Mycobacteroides abscessus]